jgi:hypothetical protein
MTDNKDDNAGNKRVPGNKRPAGSAKKITARKAGQSPRGSSSSSSKPRSGGKSGGKRVAAKPTNRRNFIIGFIALIVIFDVVVLGVWAISNTGDKVPPNPDPVSLIQSQMPPEYTIPEIGYDSNLTFDKHPDISIANVASMKSIENNLYKKGGAADGSNLLYDALTVNRVLRLNTDWIQYLNQGNEKVFESVANDSAKQKLIEVGAGSQIAFHRIALGEIRHIGNKYYILAQVNYILVKNGQQQSFDEVFVYELVRSRDTLLVSNLEHFPQGAVPAVTPDTNPGTDPAQTEDAAGGEPEAPADETAGETGEEQESTPEEGAEGETTAG